MSMLLAFAVGVPAQLDDSGSEKLMPKPGASSRYFFEDSHDKIPLKRFLVIYKDRISEDDELNIARRGARITHKFDALKAIATELKQEEIEKIRLDPNVKAVVDDIRVHASLQDSVPQIKANQVHTSGINGSGVKICIVDTGIDDSHSSLPELVDEIDIVNNDNDATDDNGHGTHVAGIVASSHPVYKGVAYGASLMAAKVLDVNGSGWGSDVIAGIEWCVENGADIISMSLGGGAYTGSCDSEPMAQASNNAVDHGTLVFAASGNDGYLNAIAVPACGSKVIAVGAVDKNDQRTPYSNEGTELDLVAPGNFITSTYLNNGFATFTGTSMATPHASGVAGLILDANHSLTPAQVRSILENTAFDLGTAGFDTIYGHGRLDALAAFQAVNDGNSGNDSGQQVFFDDFQGGSGNWVESIEFDWNIEAPNEKQIPGESSNNRVMHADACTSTNGCRLTLRNQIDLSSYNGAALKFWRYVDSEIGNKEFLRVDAYNGNFWSTLAQWSNNNGDDDQWHYEILDLSDYLVSDFKLRFVSKESLGSEVTEIDKVLIESLAESQSCASDAECDDGVYCNGEERCISGACQSSPSVDCSSLNSQCNAGICDEASDSCVLQNANEGFACDDGLYCNVGETCQSGACAGGSQRICPNDPQCGTSACDEDTNSCINNPVPDGTACDDNLFCTVNDLCVSGSCTGSSMDCSDNVVCTVDSCDETNDACNNAADNSFCSDNVFCNGIEICDLNIGCTPGILVSCNDNNDCTADSCDENSDSCSFSSTCEQLCWSGSNSYLRKEGLNFKKFCKCAQGTYGYSSYYPVSGTKTAYQYTDIGDNNNWATSPVQSLSVKIVKCKDNKWYNTSVDYYR